MAASVATEFDSNECLLLFQEFIHRWFSGEPSKFLCSDDVSKCPITRAGNAYHSILPPGYPPVDSKLIKVQLAEVVPSRNEYTLSRLDQLSRFSRDLLGPFCNAEYLNKGENSPNITLQQFLANPTCYRLDCTRFGMLLKKYLEQKDIVVDIIFASPSIIIPYVFASFANCMNGHMYVVFNDIMVSLLPGGVQYIPTSDFDKIPQMLKESVQCSIIKHVEERSAKCRSTIQDFEKLPQPEKDTQFQEFVHKVKIDQQSLDRALGAFEIVRRAELHGSGTFVPQLLSDALKFERERCIKFGIKL